MQIVKLLFFVTIKEQFQKHLTIQWQNSKKKYFFFLKKKKKNSKNNITIKIKIKFIDLADSGSYHFAQTVREIKSRFEF